MQRDLATAGVAAGVAVGVAKYKWPERLEIVAELPLTKVGKIDKKALREILAGGDFNDRHRRPFDCGPGRR